VQVPGGAPCEYLIPLATPEEEERKNRRKSALLCEFGRSKYAGLGPRSSKRASSIISTTTKVPQRFLECKVVPEQPSLRIRWSSLSHGATMLYDGEMRV
jgi:trafficking protein particle complex subunit 9